MALDFVGEALGPVYELMQALVREGDGDLARRGQLAEAVGGRPGRERLAAVLDLARAVLAGDLRSAEPDRQARMIEAYAALVRLSAQAPTYNYDPGLLVMEIGGLLASVAVPREGT
jgi:DNA polymerase-3 subunit delta'